MGSLWYHIISFFLVLPNRCTGFLGRSSPKYSSSSFSSSRATSLDDNDDHIAAAVLVPGFLTGEGEFNALKKTLRDQGVPTICVPMPNWHWLPCLGGRSVRPILERIDFAVQHVVAKLENDEDFLTGRFPTFDYSYFDAWNDFLENPGGVAKVGGVSEVKDYPKDVNPRGSFVLPKIKNSTKKIALIGHSAGGWISRIYISDHEYGGKVYGGSKYVHSLVTLGTPHASAPGPAFSGISWINNHHHLHNDNNNTATVRSLAVAGRGFQGDQWGSLTQSSYAFCCPHGSDGSSYDGDGLTPVFSALAMPKSEAMILSKRVTHFGWSEVGWTGKLFAPELYQDMKENNGLWYGSDEIVAEWLPWILQGSK